MSLQITGTTRNLQTGQTAALRFSDLPAKEKAKLLWFYARLTMLSKITRLAAFCLGLSPVTRIKLGGRAEWSRTDV